MNENQIARMEEARNSFLRGDIGSNELQTQTTQILMEDESAEPMPAPPTTEFNPPPSPLHVWNGDTWVLPAQHEIEMLVEIEGHTEEDLEVAEDRLTEQQGELDAMWAEAEEEQEVA